MNRNSPPPARAGGFAIAAGVVVGAIVGGLLGQPSIGLLAGFGVGVISALLIWLTDRRR